MKVAHAGNRVRRDLPAIVAAGHRSDMIDRDGLTKHIGRHRVVRYRGNNTGRVIQADW